MIFLLFLGGFGGSKGFKYVQNIKEYKSQYLQTYFLPFFPKKIFCQKYFWKKYFFKNIFLCIFLQFFFGQMPDNNQLQPTLAYHDQKYYFQGILEGGAQCAPPLSQMWAQDPLSIRVKRMSCSKNNNLTYNIRISGTLQYQGDPIKLEAGTPIIRGALI